LHFAISEKARDNIFRDHDGRIKILGLRFGQLFPGRVVRVRHAETNQDGLNHFPKFPGTTPARCFGPRRLHLSPPAGAEAGG